MTTGAEGKPAAGQKRKLPRLIIIGARNLFEPGVPRVSSIMTRAEWLSRYYEIHVVSLGTTAAPPPSQRPHFIESITILPTPGLWRVAWNIVGAFFRRRPLQEFVYATKSGQDAVESLLLTVQPDLLLLDTVRALAYLPNYHRWLVAGILDMNDLFSERYRRMLKSGTLLNPYGKLAELLPPVLSALLNRLSGFALRYEQNAMERREISATKEFAAAVLYSDLEATKLRQVTGRKNIFAIRQMLAELDLGGAPGKPDFDSKAAYFVGNFSYSANLQALELLLSGILPGVIQRHPEFRLHVVGKNIPQNLLSAYRGNPHVVFDGAVKSLKDHVSGIPMLIAPFVSGSGIKTKVIEAMAWGKAVISNEIGFEGLGVRPDIDVVQASGCLEFVARINNAFDRPEWMRDLGGQALILIQRDFDLDRLGEEWHRLIENVRTGKP